MFCKCEIGLSRKVPPAEAKGPMTDDLNEKQTSGINYRSEEER